MYERVSSLAIILLSDRSQISQQCIHLSPMETSLRFFQRDLLADLRPSLFVRAKSQGCPHITVTADFNLLPISQLRHAQSPAIHYSAFAILISTIGTQQWRLDYSPSPTSTKGERNPFSCVNNKVRFLKTLLSFHRYSNRHEHELSPLQHVCQRKPHLGL